jgi:glutamate-1-semialdehyde 2,1-aminomutase
MLWTNPLLLLTLLLENYMIRSDLFAWDLDDRIVALERQTGVVFAGRAVRAKELNIKTNELPNETIAQLTRDTHTLLTEIIFYERVVEWSGDCAAFLKELSAKVTDITSEKEYGRESSLRKGFRDVEENVDLLMASAKSMCGFQAGLKQRVQSQINVVNHPFPLKIESVSNRFQLYSFIAQIENSLNAKIAVSSVRDSSAMKTLALITTIFFTRNLHRCM